MFVARYVLPLLAVVSFAACDRSGDPLVEPPRGPTPKPHDDLAAPGVEDTTAGGDQHVVDELGAPTHDAEDSFYDEDLSCDEGEGEAGEDCAWLAATWCEEPDDVVCEYQYDCIE